MTPLFMDDLDIMTRPVSYLKTEVKSNDGNKHSVKVKISVSEEICLNYRGEDEVVTEEVASDSFAGVKIGSVKHRSRCIRRRHQNQLGLLLPRCKFRQGLRRKGCFSLHSPQT